MIPTQAVPSLTADLRKALCVRYFGSEEPPRAFDARAQMRVQRIKKLEELHSYIVNNPGISAKALSELMPDILIRAAIQELRRLNVIKTVDYGGSRGCGYVSMIACAQS